MSKHIDGYLRAIDEGTVEKYHDHHDVRAGKMYREDYEKKWGHYQGDGTRKKHV